jgi:transmembrane sensor
MEDNKNNIETSKEQETFNNMKVDYAESKGDIWAQMEAEIDSDAEKSPNKKVFKMAFVKWSAAAIILLTIGLGFFAKLYTLNVDVSKGEFVSHRLPDGSEVYLNAESSISYHPYWWNFDREVNLEGEAFFEVEKGEKFTVKSDLGTTEVLGTSFNIFARDKNYFVYCSTGKVRVSDLKGESVLLSPGTSAEIKDDKVKLSLTNENEVLSWRLNKFIYNTTSLNKVFEDIERQYDITIDAKKQIRNKVYTGVFDRTVSSNEALKIICLSFDLDFEETANNTYRIY